MISEKRDSKQGSLFDIDEEFDYEKLSKKRKQNESSPLNQKQNSECKFNHIQNQQQDKINQSFQNAINKSSHSEDDEMLCYLLYEMDLNEDHLIYTDNLYKVQSDYQDIQLQEDQIFQKLQFIKNSHDTIDVDQISLYDSQNKMINEINQQSKESPIFQRKQYKFQCAGSIQKLQLSQNNSEETLPYEQFGEHSINIPQTFSFKAQISQELQKQMIEEDDQNKQFILENNYKNIGKIGDVFLQPISKEYQLNRQSNQNSSYNSQQISSSNSISNSKNLDNSSSNSDSDSICSDINSSNLESPNKNIFEEGYKNLQIFESYLTIPNQCSIKHLLIERKIRKKQIYQQSRLINEEQNNITYNLSIIQQQKCYIKNQINDKCYYKSKSNKHSLIFGQEVKQQRKQARDKNEIKSKKLRCSYQKKEQIKRTIHKTMIHHT